MSSDSVLIPKAMTAAAKELAQLRELSSALAPPPAALLPHPAPSAPPAPAPALAPAPAPAPSPAPALAPAPSTPAPPPPYASEREVRRLEAAVREYADVNERIMAQNIALLSDLEAAQRTVRELRAGKDALAVQLRRSREAAAAAAAAGGEAGARR